MSPHLTNNGPQQNLAEMAAVGFDLPVDTFRSKMEMGPHLLAPTASDFNRFGDLGTVLAGFHYGALDDPD